YWSRIEDSCLPWKRPFNQLKAIGPIEERIMDHVECGIGEVHNRLGSGPFRTVIEVQHCLFGIQHAVEILPLFRLVACSIETDRISAQTKTEFDHSLFFHRYPFILIS